MYKKVIFSLILNFIVYSMQAQDIESALKAPLLSSNGGITVNNIATFVPSDSIASNPFALFLSGNLSLNFLGTVELPLSFSYTNQQLSKSASLPFNRFSLSPSYKWIKVYAGYTSMSFSPYSLSGHELLGGGVEVSPDNGMKISALYGRLRKASADLDDIGMSYERMGGGLKVEYQKEAYSIGANLFRANDLKHSLILSPDDSLTISPQENLTGSVNFSLNLIENLRWSSEYGFSSLNRNSPIQEGDKALYHAVKTQLSFSRKIGSIGATYEYIAPNYTTLGAYYMNNDFENITANISTAVRQFNIAFDIGYQHNNLDKQKNSSTSRVIYSGNVSGKLTEKLNTTFTFSNLQSYLYINDVYSQVTQTNQYQNLDTLNVTQLNYTATLNTNYALQNSEQQRQDMNIGLTYQKSAETQQYSTFAGNDIYNVALGYQYSLVPLEFSASTAVNYNYNTEDRGKFSQAMNYNISLQKNLFKHLKTSLSATYSNMNNQAGNLSDVWNMRLSGSYTLAKKHNFNLSAISLYTKSLDRIQNQYIINLSYAYSFGIQMIRKEKKLRLDTNF